MSDSSSEDNAPIASKLNKNIEQKIDETSEDESSSDDDIPINQLSRNKQAHNSSSDEPLISKRKHRESNTSSDSPLISKRKRSNRFNDSDESADDDNDDDECSSSDDNEPIVKATEIIKRLPKKRPRKASNDCYSSSSTPSPKRRKKGSTSSPGYIGRECNNPSRYRTKDSVKSLSPLTGALKWWEQEDDGTVSYRARDDSKSKIKWRTLDHNGIVFAPPYVAHGIPIKYDGKVIKLTAEQEEIATMYAVMIESDWAQKEKFKKNFMREFQKILRDKKQSQQYQEIVETNNNIRVRTTLDLKRTTHIEKKIIKVYIDPGRRNRVYGIRFQFGDISKSINWFAPELMPPSGKNFLKIAFKNERSRDRALAEIQRIVKNAKQMYK